MARARPCPTAAVALAALLVFPTYFLRSFAYAGIAVILIAVLGGGHAAGGSEIRIKPVVVGARGYVTACVDWDGQHRG